MYGSTRKGRKKDSIDLYKYINKKERERDQGKKCTQRKAEENENSIPSIFDIKEKLEIFPFSR